MQRKRLRLSPRFDANSECLFLGKFSQSLVSVSSFLDESLELLLFKSILGEFLEPPIFKSYLGNFLEPLIFKLCIGDFFEPVTNVQRIHQGQTIACRSWMCVWESFRYIDWLKTLSNQKSSDNHQAKKALLRVKRGYFKLSADFLELPSPCLSCSHKWNDHDRDDVGRSDEFGMFRCLVEAFRSLQVWGWKARASEIFVKIRERGTQRLFSVSIESACSKYTQKGVHRDSSMYRSNLPVQSTHREGYKDTVLGIDEICQTKVHTERGTKISLYVSIKSTWSRYTSCCRCGGQILFFTKARGNDDQRLFQVFESIAGPRQIYHYTHMCGVQILVLLTKAREEQTKILFDTTNWLVALIT